MMDFVTHQIVGIPFAVRQITPSVDETTGSDEEPAFCYGWHGNDVPPCGGTWIADLEGAKGAIIVIEADEDNEDDEIELSLPDGWVFEAAEEVKEGWNYRDDSGWSCAVLKQDPISGAVWIAGMI